ncbi:MAG: hypothetical protein JO359_13440 [Candidatus Eremiobacteraeota bacterium]|nr:hypothetical protein [Candidatus Eremiobacteraeota bacterium]
MTLSLAPPILPGGFAQTDTLNVVVKDPDGNALPSSVALPSPLTLTNSDTSGNTSLSTTSVTQGTQAVTVSYSGTTAPLTASFGATGAGISSSSVHGATLTITTPQSLYISLLDNNVMNVYAPGANGAAAPRFSVAQNTPEGIVFDNAGHLFLQSSSSPTSSGSIVQYVAASLPGASPVGVIAGPNTNTLSPFPLAIDAGQNLYSGSANATNPSIAVFAPGSSGNVAPIRRIAGSATGLVEPYAFAFDASGNLYVSNFPQNSAYPVEIFAPNANGNVAPIATIAGSNTGLSNGARGIAFDSSGNLFVATVDSNLNGIIEVFAPGATGNVAPLYTISGSNTLLSRPKGIAFDNAGELCVANIVVGPNTFNITFYAPGASGNATPVRTITGQEAGTVGPLYPAFGPPR